MGSDQKVAPKTKEQTPNKRPDSPGGVNHHKGLQELEGTVLCYRGEVSDISTGVEIQVGPWLDPSLSIRHREPHYSSSSTS